MSHQRTSITRYLQQYKPKFVRITHNSRFCFVAAAAVPPQFVERLTTKEARESDSVRFQVRVTGNPAPQVTWYREDAAIVSSPDFEIQQVRV